MNTKEMWQDINGFQGLYMVNPNGDIMSCVRNKILKACLDTKGYKIIRLSKLGKKKTTTIHRLVGLAFVPNPNNKPQINHKDGDKLNNCYWNLEWCTRDENIAHAKEIGLIAYGEYNTAAKLSNEQAIGIFTDQSRSYSELSKAYNVSKRCVGFIKNKETWRKATKPYWLQPPLLQ